MTEQNNGDDLEPRKLTREEVLSASAFSREQAMMLVGLYYDTQKVRVGQSNKLSAHGRCVDFLAEPGLVALLKGELHKVEKQAARALAKYAAAQRLGRWCLSVAGVGPVLAAGLLAHVDPARSPTAGALWRFAGLDPTCEWRRGEKRPYNARLKTLCWKLGESFKKLGEVDEDQGPEYLYARLYRERKTLEVVRNESGGLRQQALARLNECLKAKRRISPEQRETWASGKLQKRGLDLRAGRYAVKIFLAHFHRVGYEILGLPLVKPWVIEHGGHVHEFTVPCWPCE